MGKFLVDGTTGVSYTKKRKRVKNANHHCRPEVKQYNPFVTVGSDNNRDNYGSFYISNIFNPNTTGETYAALKYGSWDPILVHDPNAGSRKSERIGDQWFLKYMRFKGYITISDSVYRDVNWRLVLYRSNEGPLYTADQLFPNTRMDKVLGEAYKAYEAFSSVSETLPDTAIARHNFYKKIINVDKKDVVSRKIIASGTIPQSWTGRWTSNHTFGATSGVQHGFDSDFVIGDGRRYVPLDIKVSCNDWIKLNEVYYYICLEVDSIKGLNVSNPTTSSLIGASESVVYSQSMFIFNLYCRSYFIDP